MQPEEILESISGGFFALDADYRFIYWNRAAEEGTGFPRSEVIGKHVFEIFPNAEKAELGERYRSAMETRTFQSFETAYQDSNFEAWYNIRIYPTEKGISVFFQDITIQKHQEQQRETLFEVSHAINSSNQVSDLGAAIVRSLAHRYQIPENQVLVYLHRSADNQLYLIAPEGIAPEWENHLSIISLKGLPALASADALHSRSPVVTSDVSRSVFYSCAPEKVITPEPMTVLAFPLQAEQEMIGVIEILLNRKISVAERERSFLSLVANEVAIGISRRGLIDELRVKNVDLEIQRTQTQNAHDTMKKFLAFFSHELRSPLNSIIGFSELILSDYAKLTQETIKEYITSVNASGSHLLSLINDILDLSKLEAGKMELHYTPVQLRSFIEGIAKSIQPQLEAKQLRIDLQLTDELDEIFADDVRFRQILLNLLTNAVKFSHTEGSISIMVRRSRNDVEIAVEDFGMGIPSEELDHIFKPFHQTTASSRKREGSGLGLSITKRLVELHGGSLSVVSEWQKGSTFIVHLPMMVRSGETQTEVASAISEMLPRSTAPHKVLIVEDKPHARQLLHTYLSEAGYIIDTASNGIEALEKAKIWKPDVITLDILLPMKDGWQVLSELKQHPLCKDIPVIIISMVDERNVGFGLGAVDYFVKPVQKDELIQSIQKITRKQSTLQRSAKILVIDDDKSVTDLIQVILEAEGCTVLKAMNGTDGLKAAEVEQPDLIILDLVMPGISGFNVAYQLKHNPKTHAIPVMIMTSLDLDDEMRGQLQGFVVSLMRKSGFTKRDLLHEIASIEGLRGETPPKK